MAGDDGALIEIGLAGHFLGMDLCPQPMNLESILPSYRFINRDIIAFFGLEFDRLPTFEGRDTIQNLLSMILQEISWVRVCEYISKVDMNPNLKYVTFV